MTPAAAIEVEARSQTVADALGLGEILQAIPEERVLG